MFDGTWNLSRGWEAFAFTCLIIGIGIAVYVLKNFFQKYERPINRGSNRLTHDLSKKKTVRNLRIVTIITGGIGLYAFFKGIIDFGNTNAAAEGQWAAGLFIMLLAPPMLLIYGLLFIPWEKFSKDMRIAAFTVMLVILSGAVAIIIAEYL